MQSVSALAHCNEKCVSEFSVSSIFLHCKFKVLHSCLSHRMLSLLHCVSHATPLLVVWHQSSILNGHHGFPSFGWKMTMIQLERFLFLCLLVE